MTPLVRSLAAALFFVACGGTETVRVEAVSLPAQAGSSSALDDQGRLAQASANDEADAAVPISGSDASRGSRNALVTIVEFADFQCPYCSRAADTVAKVQKEYGEHTVRLVFKNDPLSFHPEARPCAESAEAVRAIGGNAAFWTFYDLAFHNQQDLNMASYETWAKQAGLTLTAFHDAVSGHRSAAKVESDLALAEQLGVNGTPAFFINGISVTGAQPIEKFRTLIDAQISAAKEKLAKGTIASELYTALAKENFKKADDDDDHADTKTVWKIPVGTSPAIGNKTAAVTIIEFSDFQCPFCKRVQPALQQIRTTYPNDVRIVFKHMPLPFHPRAEPAAELALEARAEKGDTGFWAAHDKLFDAQPNLDDADLERIGKDLHLDAAKVHAAITSKKYLATITDDQDTGDDFKASGTPHFFVNGRRLVGAQPFDAFKKIIDDEIVKARALVAAGTKPEDVYAELTKAGQTPAPPPQKTITLSGNAASKGAVAAQVTIMELADFQCSACKQSDDALAEVLKAYPTRVKIVWRHAPQKSHAQAQLAAEASVEAFKQKGNDGFWKLHDALFAHADDPDGLERSHIDSYAMKLGLDMAKFRTALDTGLNASAVDADAKSTEDAGIKSVPGFLVGAGPAAGSWTAYYLSGTPSVAKLKKLVELALGSHP